MPRAKSKRKRMETQTPWNIPSVPRTRTGAPQVGDSEGGIDPGVSGIGAGASGSAGGGGGSGRGSGEIPAPSMPPRRQREQEPEDNGPAPEAPPPRGPPPRPRTYLPPGPPPPPDPHRSRSTKPKRRKKRTAQNRTYSIPTIPRTPSGAPQLPLNVGITTVRSLGRVCLEKHFHTERYIFPVGYEVTRRYMSMRDAEAEVEYTCKILRGEDVDGGIGPRFRITPSDDVMNPVTAGTATGAWSVVVRNANKIRGRKHSNSVSGPDFFGLGQNTIKHLLQELEGADSLETYVRQQFTEGGPFGDKHTPVSAAINTPGPSGSSAADNDIQMRDSTK